MSAVLFLLQGMRGLYGKDGKAGAAVSCFQCYVTMCHVIDPGQLNIPETICRRQSKYCYKYSPSLR